MRQAFCAGVLAAAFSVTLAFLFADTAVEATVRGEESTTKQPDSIQAAAEVEQTDRNTLLTVLFDDEEQQISMEDYLTGVLCAEMPASFELEALKAQAIASRTFTLRQLQAGKHGSAAVCTSSSCCQGYLSREMYLQKVGAQGEQYYDRLHQAVTETDGKVVTYAGDLIDATFFSCSGGRTEAAAAVWGGDIPYLQAVDSPGEEAALRYSETLELPVSEFVEKLRTIRPAFTLDVSRADAVGAVTRTAGDGVETIEISGEAFTGKELRKLFSLRSTRFVLTLADGVARFETRGNGHRVGLSQYGANARAQEGADCEEILRYYYQGTEIKKLSRTASGQLTVSND